MIKQRKPYIDIVIDLETLGSEISSTVTQVSAQTFHIDKIDELDKYQSFNEVLDLSTIEGKLQINLNTLQFWTKMSNVSTFRDLIHSHSDNDEQTLWTKFSDWLVELSKTYTLRVWGNGILFDIGKVTYNLKRFNLPYPVKFWDERDVRTITELAAIKLNCYSPEFQKLTPNTHHHDALADVIWEAQYMRTAYDVVINGNQIDELTKKLQKMRAEKQKYNK